MPHEQYTTAHPAAEEKYVAIAFMLLPGMELFPLGFRSSFSDWFNPAIHIRMWSINNSQGMILFEDLATAGHRATAPAFCTRRLQVPRAGVPDGMML